MLDLPSCTTPVERSIIEFLGRLPAHWLPFEPGDMNNVEAQALDVLVNAGLVERFMTVTLRDAKGTGVAADLSVSGDDWRTEATRTMLEPAKESPAGWAPGPFTVFGDQDADTLAVRLSETGRAMQDMLRGPSGFAGVIDILVNGIRSAQRSVCLLSIRAEEHKTPTPAPTEVPPQADHGVSRTTDQKIAEALTLIFAHGDKWTAKDYAIAVGCHVKTLYKWKKTRAALKFFNLPDAPVRCLHNDE